MSDCFLVTTESQAEASDQACREDCTLKHGGGSVMVCRGLARF